MDLISSLSDPWSIFMRHTSALPLHHRGVYRSRNAEETRAFMASKEFTLDLAPKNAKQFDFVANIGYMPGSYLGYIQYGAAATIHVPDVRARDDYWVHFPLSGASEISNNAGDIVCANERAVISSPVGHVTRSEACSTRLTLSVTRAAIINHLAALIGDAPNKPLEFSPILDLASPGGRRLTSYVELALMDLNEPAERACSPIIQSMHEQLLLTGLLLSHANNYTNKLESPDTRHGPLPVLRAIDFIEAHLNTAITLTDITMAAGIPGRTLLKHFKDCRGVSPMRYLHDARLAQVRNALFEAGNDESVTQIALAWGLTHLGRFSVDYRRRFGETPSETLKRTRKASPRTRAKRSPA
jgi:AraC-like DNA-binding protein